MIGRCVKLVDTLSWFSNQTRPDIFNALRVFATDIDAPKLKHWLVTRGHLEHQKLTSSYKMYFQTDSGLELIVYADVAYALMTTRRRPVSGEAVRCGCVAIK